MCLNNFFINSIEEKGYIKNEPVAKPKWPIMISYEPKSRDNCFKIRDELKVIYNQRHVLKPRRNTHIYS